jgi:hypothetical protein
LNGNANLEQPALHYQDYAVVGYRIEHRNALQIETNHKDKETQNVVHYPICNVPKIRT